MSDLIANDFKRFTNNFLDSVVLCNFVVGTYMADGKVVTDQNMPIPANKLIIPQRFTDYEIDIQLDGVMKKIKVFNHLLAGDKLWLLKQQGGQQYLVLDRVQGTEYKQRY